MKQQIIAAFNDIVAVRIECPDCHSVVSLPPEQWRLGPVMECRACSTRLRLPQGTAEMLHGMNQIKEDGAGGAAAKAIIEFELRAPTK